MNELAASMSIKRSPEMLQRKIAAHREVLDVYRNLAADFAALDMRPFFWNPETQSITYTRDLNIPENLLAMIREEAEAIASLQNELYA